MSLLSQVTTGKVKKPRMILIHGIPGVGKSTFAADAPKPIFLGTEDGTSNLDTARFDPAPHNFDQVMAYLKALLNDEHDYRTVVIDSLDHLEPLVWARVCQDEGVSSIEKIGYGKGYIFALTYWNEIISTLKALRERRGMNVILIAHSIVKEFKDPSLQTDYHRYRIKLHEKAAALFMEACEEILFANYEVLTRKDEGGKLRTVGDGARLLYTEWRPAFDAKNRSGLPFQLPLSWEEYEQAAAKGEPNDVDALKKKIDACMAKIKDEAVREAVKTSMKKAGDVPANLEKIYNRLQARLSA